MESPGAALRAAVKIGNAGPIGMPTRAIGMTPWQSWTIVAIVTICSAFMGMVFTVVTPVLPAIANHLASAGAQSVPVIGVTIDSAFSAQMFISFASVGFILGGAPGGWLVARFGIRPVLVTSLVLYGVLGSAGLFLDDQWSLLTTRLFLGFTAVGLGTSTISLLSECFDDKMRARVIGYRSAFGALGSLIGTLLAGQMAEFGGWRAPFALYLLAIIVALAAATILPSLPPRARQTAARDGASISLLLPFCALIVALNVAVFMAVTQIPFLLASDAVTSPSTLSLVSGVSSGTVMIGAGIYGLIRVRLGPRRTFGLALALMAVGNLAAGLSHQVSITGLACAFAGLGSGILNPHLVNTMIDRAPLNLRSRAIGLMYTAIFAGEFLNPLIIVPLRSALGIHIAFLVVGALLAGGAALSVLRVAVGLRRQDHA